MKTQTRNLTPRSGPGALAFTRLELAAVLGALALLVALALPVLANSRERSLRILCVNNLKQCGQAFLEWGTEHGERLPWRTEWYEGGTKTTIPAPPGSPIAPYWVGNGDNNYIYFQWAWVSNELRTPKILVCPSDAGKKVASDWGRSSVGGFMHANFQGNAVSYLIGLDVLPTHADGLIAGDRNVIRSSVSGCSSGIVPGYALDVVQGTFSIDKGLHERAGNFTFKDGHVEELSSQAFVRKMVSIPGGSEKGNVHYMVP